MLFGDVVFGGLGTALYSLVLIALAVLLIAGLMIGRTPEHLGKRLPSRRHHLRVRYGRPRRPAHLMASGLMGEPTAPVMGSGGATNWNSQTPSVAQSAARASRSKISPTRSPMVGMKIWWSGW